MRIAAVPRCARATCTLAGFALKPPRWWARQDLNLGQIVPNDLA